MIDFKIGEEGVPEKQLLETIELVFKESVKSYHPHFHNTLFGGFDHFAISGAMISPFINGNMYTYEMASCFTLMEQEVYEHFRNVLAWPTVDGIMAPGGSFGNFIAIHTARFWKFPQVKENGIGGLGNLKIMVSEVSHYSLKKGVNLAGMGTNCLVNVKTDKIGRMCPIDLEAKIVEEMEKGNCPFMVCSTIGTTVEGAIDKIEPIGKICKKYNLWYHLDAALGGVFFASPQLRHKIGNCEDVDSVVWDPHKGLLVPLQACVFLCKHMGLMEDCNSTAADYLFHKQRKSYDNVLDTGNKSLQCGRIIDILKLWIYFKGNGWKSISDQVQRQNNLSQYIKKYVTQRPQRFKLAIEEVETFNVCFWYYPKQLRRQDFEDEKQYLKVLNDVTVLAKKYMIEDGKILVGYSKVKESIYFWRTVMSNPYISQKDVDYEMELIAKYCEQAYEEIVTSKNLKHQSAQTNTAEQARNNEEVSKLNQSEKH